MSAVLKETSKKYAWILTAVIVMLIVIKLPLPESVIKANGGELTLVGRTSLGILLFCLILWMTEPIPFHITGMFGLILLTIFQVTTFKDAVRTGFGNDTVVFFIGVLILSSFITRTGLGRRISMLILSKTGNDTRRILLGFLFTGAMIAMWITAMAAAAIMTPLAVAMVKEEGLKPQKSNFAKALLISCAWGPLIGGIGTPAGAGPNQLAIGFINDMMGINISFLDWMTYGIPASLTLIIPAWLVLLCFFKPEIRNLSKDGGKSQKQYQEMPPISHDEKATLVVFVLTVILWITSPWLGELMGVTIPTSLPAMLSGCLLFLPGMTQIKWAEVTKDISWNGIILIASGISLGMQVYNSGAAEWITRILLGGIAELAPIPMIFLLVLMVSLIKVGLSSNTVTATVIIPIVIELVEFYNLPALGVIMPVSLTLSLAFILVTSTPTSVIPYGVGYFKISDMVRAGVVLTLISSVIMALVIYGIGSLTGIY